MIVNTAYISSWKSKGLSDKIIKPPSTSDNSLSPVVVIMGLTKNADIEKYHYSGYGINWV